MSERLTVVVTGLLGSGKTSLCESLAGSYGFDTRNIGDELARLYRVRHQLAADTPVPGLERIPEHKRVRQTDPTYFSRFVLGGSYERRVIDGLRNFDDAEAVIAANGIIISLLAPRPVRMSRRLGLDETKDASLDAMVARELSELQDPDPHGAQTLQVMALAHEHGFFVDATQSAEMVFEDTVKGLAAHDVTL